jgi:hypothetical protein
MAIEEKSGEQYTPPVQSATDIPHHRITQDLALQNEDLESIANREAVPFTMYYPTQLV